MTQNFSPEEQEALYKLIAPHNEDARQIAREVVSDDLWQPNFDLTLDEEREVVLKRLIHLVKSGVCTLDDHLNDMLRYLAGVETMSYACSATSTKIGVQFGLFGAAVGLFGTDKHRPLLKRIADLEVLGGFCMTEVGHGSNVRGVRTTAHYDHATRTITVNTPDDDAAKIWIGNSAKHGHQMVVFAQLFVNGKNQGVHVVIVPVRDHATHKVLPGVQISDMGHKTSINGVDNGRLWFTNVKVPVDNLLDRFGGISADGEYVAKLHKSPTRRFAAHLAALIGGRVVISSCALAGSRNAIHTAVHYTHNRRQFSASRMGAQEPLWSYQSVKGKLIPLIAKQYALAFSNDVLQRRLANENRSASEERDLHVHASGLKPASSWFCRQAIQTCREACGGNGILAEAKFGEWLTGSDPGVTFEGANSILLHQVGHSLVSQFRSELGKGYSGALAYLSKQAGVVAKRKNALVTRIHTSQHLRSADFIISALEYREGILLRRLVVRLAKLSRDGAKPFDAANACQIQVEALAKAHVARISAEHFATAVSNASRALGPRAHAVMKNVFAVYGLTEISRHSGFFLLTRFLQRVKVEAIAEELLQLYEDVAPFAAALTTSWRIPEATQSILVSGPAPVHALERNRHTLQE